MAAQGRGSAYMLTWWCTSHAAANRQSGRSEAVVALTRLQVPGAALHEQHAALWG